jgi:AcrR family transcriptional regulator
MAEKVDRRIRKTKSQLKHGLAKLMMKKDISEISVKELVETVDINRSTFYLHYCDIYNLQEEIETELLTELQHILEEKPIGADNTFSFMEDVFAVLEKNKEICMALMGDYGDANFILKVRKIVEGNAMKQLEKQFADKVGDLRYTVSFCLSGCMGIVNQWLFENGQETPEHMAKLTFQMVMHALGIDKYEDLIK